MSHPLYVAFIWHQHQPIYKSPQNGEYRLPWVRLHGTKDYLDLMLILERYPNIHQTVNLVPSLILQLEEYASGTAVDYYQKLSLTPVADLQEDEKREIIDHFFDANLENLISPHPRYLQLYKQKHAKGNDWCLKHWQDDDYSDLLAWHNLAWIDPIFWNDPQINKWLKQGKHFSLKDRQEIIDKQREIIRRIIPQHKLMQERGQIEVTTTPYTHPILPLLANINNARIAIADLPLPTQSYQWPEDISRHLEKAKKIYQERFEISPKGLWPSEQSVSPEILSYVASQDFKWLCSDEAVLGWSLNHFFHRDETGSINEPEILYKPYLLETDQGNLSIVFRDHRLSDLIGFTYSTMDPQEAATDLIAHLEAISRSLRARQGGGKSLEHPWLITIALDGENCWEFYQKDGLLFLDSLYGTLSKDDAFSLVTVSEFLEKFPAQTKIPIENLHSGSWIDGTFATWIGQTAKNKAWDLLSQARKVLAQHPEATEDKNPAAWEALYAAQGSDWFWWLGTGHSSNDDDTFDLLFRENLIALYRALDEEVPDVLYQSIDLHLSHREKIPEGFINPVIDGKADEQSWDKAGCIEIGGSRGTMHQSSLIQKMFYGYNHLSFFLRIDFQVASLKAKDFPNELHFYWYYPQINWANSPIILEGIPDKDLLNHNYRHHLVVNLLSHSLFLEEAEVDGQWRSHLHQAKVTLDKCLEISVPWSDLNIYPDTSLCMIAVLADSGSFRDYLPENRLIEFSMP